MVHLSLFTGGEPSWDYRMSARDAFGLEDLSPASWHDMALRLEVDDELFEAYNTAYFKVRTIIIIDL